MSESRKFWELRRRGAQDDDVVHEPFVATLPRVNLLPAGIRDAIASRRILTWLAFGALVIITLGAVAWQVQGQAIAQGQAALDRAEADNAALQEQAAQLGPVRDLFAQIANQQKFVEETLAAQPEAAEVFQHLFDAAEQASGVEFTSVTVVYREIPEPGGVINECPNPNPFDDRVSIGCIDFSATARDRAQVSAFLLALEADPFFIGAYVSNTTAVGDQKIVTFTGSAAVSTEALATLLTPEQLDGIVSPAAPAPSEGAAP